MSTADWGQLVILGILWGGSFFFARIAVAEIPALALVLYRVALAAAVLHLWLRIQGISFAPVIEMPVPFLGLALLSGLGGPAWAKLAVIGASVSYALAVVYAKRFKGLTPSLVATGQLTASTVIMIPIVFLLYRPDQIVTSNASIIAAVVALGIFTTAFAFILYFRLIASAGATNASLVTLLVPASAIVLGILFLGERLEPLELVGLALIVSSLIVIDGRVFR